MDLAYFAYEAILSDFRRLYLQEATPSMMPYSSYSLNYPSFLILCILKLTELKVASFYPAVSLYTKSVSL
jgi:hypothetical protein